MVLHNPNNWHWVNKDVKEWARDYLTKNVVGLSAEEGETTIKIKHIDSMEGDVDVSQRKGKVITLFDVKLILDFDGSTKDDEVVEGTITIPEVAHDTEEDEYVFDISIKEESSSKQPIQPLIRSKIEPQLRNKLHELGPALIAEHGKDIQHAPGSKPTVALTSTISSSAAQAINKSTPSATAAMATKTSSIGPKVNTTSLTSTEEFRTSASELYKTFTSPDRLAAFTRAPLKRFTGSKVGGEFELFGGNVSGKFLELEEPKKIVQDWRLQQWPEGHHSILEINFEEKPADGVTMMKVKWDGVPVGQEEVTRRNWGEYYVRSIKTTFGFGTIL